MVRDYHGPNKRIPGVVVKKRGPVTYDVKIAKGRRVKRHVDQLRLWDSNPETFSVTQEDANVLDNHHYPSPESELPSQATQNPAVSEHRYPQHECRPPDRFVPNSNGQ